VRSFLVSNKSCTFPHNSISFTTKFQQRMKICVVLGMRFSATHWHYHQSLHVGKTKKLHKKL